MEDYEIQTQEVTDYQTILNNYNLETYHVDRLPGFVNDCPQILDYIHKAMNYTSDVAFDLEEFDQHELLDDLEAGLKECINLENAINLQKNTFSKLRSDVQEGNRIGEGTLKYNEYWDSEMRKYNSLSEKEKYHDHEKYKEFKQLIWSVKHPDSLMPNWQENEDNDDIVVAAAKKSLKCPITTSWLEEPVTSKRCTHTFSKSAIMGMIERARVSTVECPIPGCHEALTKESFYDDTLMERMVAMEKAKEQNNGSQFHDVE